ncbi:MAG: TAT-variant-translocated molybdopterin oxidoreductase, partial [Rhodothermales bacterium]
MIDLPIIDKADLDGGEARYWRSIADLQNPSEIRERDSEEFLPGVSDPPGGASRRQFLQIMGASMAMAGLAACRRPIEKTLPYARQPEEIIPGEPLFYATAMPFRGVLHPLVVESHEGRPTKIEGNPEHPMSLGATSVFDQASILNLYDPDRSHRVLQDGNQATWR